MEVSGIISEIDSQILKLQQARALLAEFDLSPATKVPSKRGRPKGSKNQPAKSAAKTKTAKSATKKASKPAPAVVAKTQHRLSPEGRKRIAEAMKKRWAEKKKDPVR